MKFFGSVPYFLFMFVLSIVAAANSGTLKANTGGAGTADISNVPALEAAQDKKADVNLSGKWMMSWSNKKGKKKGGTAQIQQNGNALNGTLQSDRGSFPLTGSLQGSQVSLTMNESGQEISFTGTVNGNKMSGATKGGESWTGTRQ